MKYLVFNLVVAAALIYLFNGSEGGLGGYKEKTSDRIEAVKTHAEIPALPPRNLHQSPANPDPLVQAMVEPQMPNIDTPPALPEPIEIPKLNIPEMPPLSFDTIQEKPMEVAQEPTILSLPIEPQNSFMTTKDRHKALLRLAEDMEYFSAESMGRQP